MWCTSWKYSTKIWNSTFNRNSTFCGTWVLNSLCTVRLIEFFEKKINSTLNRTVRLIGIWEYKDCLSLSHFQNKVGKLLQNVWVKGDSRVETYVTQHLKYYFNIKVSLSFRGSFRLSKDFGKNVYCVIFYFVTVANSVEQDSMESLL